MQKIMFGNAKEIENVVPGKQGLADLDDNDI
jgi:hypothetical protein